MTSIALNDRALQDVSPHGFVVDLDGKKISSPGPDKPMDAGHFVKAWR